MYSVNGQPTTQEHVELQRADVAEVALQTFDSLALDDYNKCPDNSRIALIQGHIVVAGGVIIKHER